MLEYYNEKTEVTKQYVISNAGYILKYNPFNEEQLQKFNKTNKKFRPNNHQKNDYMFFFTNGSIKNYE